MLDDLVGRIQMLRSPRAGPDFLILIKNDLDHIIRATSWLRSNSGRFIPITLVRKCNAVLMCVYCISDLALAGIDHVKATWTSPAGGSERDEGSAEA